MAENTVSENTIPIVKKRVDIENIIKNKNARILKILPRFILNYLKKILHENEINIILEKYKDVTGVDFVEGIIKELGVNIKVIYPENFSLTGRYIIASNHPLGGLDGLALMLTAGKMRKDIVFPVNDILLYLENLRPLFIPINKHGKNTENIDIIEKTFASDVAVLYFPAGLCSRKQKGKIIDLEWKNTFIKKAVRYERDIIPVFINGYNSNFFYNLANLRKKLGIKSNIEMLFLVDEMFKQQNNEISITFGKPISYKVFDKKVNSKKWAELVKEHVYELENNASKEFIPKGVL